MADVPNGEPSGEKHFRFSNKKYVLPFGRYVGSTEVEPPADEVLVGREGQRNYLIDLLISTGRRGAYLVTGHRGAGKTSFVKYCISEYEASVFSRFLRGNVGRGVWDRVLVLFFWMAILAGALLATEAVQFFVNSPGSTDDLLKWVILLPIGIILLYPCVYAKVVLETCIRAAAGQDGASTNQEVESGVSRWAGGAAFLIVVALAVAIWFVSPFGAPAQGISLLIPLVCALYATVQAVSFRREGRVWTWFVYGFLFVILAGAFYESVTLSRFISSQLQRQLPSGHADEIVGSLFLGHLALGLLFLGLSFILRGWDQRERIGLVQATSASALKDAIRWGARWYFFFGGVLFVVGPLLLWHILGRIDLWGAYFIIPVILLGAFFLIAREREWEGIRNQTMANEEGTTWRFQPRPMWILTAKALVSMIVALQLAHPIISFLIHSFTDTSGARYTCFLSKSLCDNTFSYTAPFTGGIQEEYWILGLLVFVTLFHLIEYEWVIRPYVRSREGKAFGAGGLAPWDEGEPETAETVVESRRRALRSLAELTLPWETYKTWLPVLPVAVNLGFDRLDHRRVIQTMLVGLRERYHRTFLAWNSGFANLGRFLGLLVLLILTASLGRLFSAPDKPRDFPEDYKIKLYGGFFDTQADDHGTAQGQGKNGTQGAGGALAMRAAGQNTPTDARQVGGQDFEKRLSAVENQLSNNGPGFGEKLWLTIRNGHAAVSIPGRQREHLLLLDLLPHWPHDTTKQKTLIYFCVYHVLLFLGLFFFGHLIVHRMPLLPYKQNLRRIDDLLDSLSARTKITSSLNLWGPARWIYSIFSDERIRETERDPVDPRTVELAFLQILEDVQKGGFRLPGAARHHLTIPAPEITFVFDELDKLGTRVDPTEEARDPAAPRQEIQVIHNERERSLKLRALLSDLKNILTSAPARFIFVGGRDLHDEWLADQTSRLPLLTSIFNTEVYLPSLLTDLEDPGTTDPHHQTSLHDRVEEYVSKQYERARLLYRRSVRKRWLPSFGLPVETLAPERFTLVKGKPSLPDVLDSDTGKPVNPDDQKFLRDDFILFLTHRSMGNPKKLRDLFFSFIRPAGREFANNKSRWIGTPYRHVIKLGNVEIFRIQLLVNIYRHLARAFEKRMVRRDDKYAISIFFLTDFLFKFHRRAFSWSNLERVDDLVHIHRLPDLREVQEEIVDHFSERFLHRVSNGIYSFRFRSDVAREVEYLSRLSPPEMAAFNFTLDESLLLKSEYLAAIEGDEGSNPDLVTALGDLYEFDQYFEQARHQYRVAINLLDGDLKRAEKKDAATTVYDILRGQGDEHARIFLPWGIARLRLMLQIGMTFELERDLEQAEAEYRSARNLARALVRAYANMYAGEEISEGKKEKGISRESRSLEGRLHSLKHMNILFQPVFSEAWLAEKFFGSVDASITLIERVLWEIRRTLPFVRNPRMYDDQSCDVTSDHANFSLTMSQLHNKAGDLYFYKGRQPVTSESIKAENRRKRTEKLETTSEGDDKSAKESTKTDRSTDGYLLRAHYHYALSLHDLRRYIQYRVIRSESLLSIAKRKTPTLSPSALPDLLFRVAVGCVNDMAEATIARVSLFELFDQIIKENYAGPYDCRKDCQEWLGKSDAETKDSDLKNWFGQWVEHDIYDVDRLDLLDFIGPDSAGERLFNSLYFCRVGAGFCEAGGYPEDSGRELLQVCETVTHYIWWGLAVERLGEAPDRSNDKSHLCWEKVLNDHIKCWKGLAENERFPMADIFRFPGKDGKPYVFWQNLAELGVQVLRQVDTLFLQSRYSGNAFAKGSGGEKSYLVGNVIPPEALTLLCSLGLSIKEAWGDAGDPLKILAKSWLGADEDRHFVGILKNLLQRHAYPMINRLKGMKVLIDNLALKKRGKQPEDLKTEEDDFYRALEWTLELLDLSTQFDAPLHFTPAHSGMTCALVWLWGSQRFASDKNWGALDRIYRAAQRDLGKSEEMYTMRRSYYEAISGLYYLYDDFNDRQIHYNHAIQMAGAELNALLKELVDRADTVWRRPDQPFSPNPQRIDCADPRAAGG